MKKLIVIICIFFLTAPKSFSQIFEENFDYPVLTVLSSTAAWTPVPLSGLIPILVTIPVGGLTFPSYAGSGVGNAATLLPGLPIVGGEDDFASLSSNQTSGSLYSSFMINVVAALTTGDYFFALRTPLGLNNSRVYAKQDGTFGFNLGIEKSEGAGVVYDATTYSILTTYLVIVKYTFVAGASNDEMSLFVFPTSSPPPMIEPTPTLGPITFGSGLDAGGLNRVLLRQGAEDISPTLIIDGIYVETAWNNSVLPVELSSFTSLINKRDVTLNWITASESNNSGFDIERSASNSSWTRIGNVAGNGTTLSANSYSYTDRNVASGNYSYRLKQIDFNGNFEYFNLSNQVSVGIPSKFDLSQNYPNPFNPSTSINFDLPVDGKVSLKIYDMTGKEVMTLVNEVRTAGYYSVSFNGSSLSSGAYFYRISAGDFTATKKMTLIK